MAVRRRPLLIVAVLSVLATASLVAVAAYIQRLPDPETADQRGLFRWLVECDLKDEPHDVQLTLMRRMEQELAAGIDFHDVMTMLDSEQRRRLIENADQLARCWFQQAARAYFEMPESQRADVLGRQLDAVRRLGIMDQLAAIEHWAQQPAANGARVSQQQTEGTERVGKRAEAVKAEAVAIAPPSKAEMAAAQMARIQRWVDEAAPRDRRQLSEYFAALRNRVFAESLQQLGGLGKLLLPH
jgi:hypothetical protein